MLAINNYICYMYRIHVENIRTKSFHGCLKEEAIIGGDYRTDVWIMLKKEYSIKKLSTENKELYGSVKPTEISKLIYEKENVEINPSNIQPSKEIKSLGEFKVEINLHSDIQTQITVKVVPQEEIK